MKIAVLTSSRADYGIYLPLLLKLQIDPAFDLRLIVFGTHLSHSHGHTIDLIEKDGFAIDYRIETVPDADSEEAISASMALTGMKFAPVWAAEKENYDLVFCLGDRYEMFAAVAASVPFNIKLAHIHGGETTLGAIDNKFRHCLSLFSELHFVSTATFANRVAEIIGYAEHIYNVGALSLDNLNDIELYTKDEFKKQFNIDMEQPTVLVTFHPETVSVDRNLNHVRALIAALNELDEQVVITMPNADTMGNTMRKEYEAFAATKSNVICIENFGTKGYFSCMQHANYLLGNTSSGIIEAASFNKYVINVGDRQKGRAVSGNILEVIPEKKAILEACKKVKELGNYKGKNIYFSSNVADQIIKVIKEKVG
ncbi:UDP-N-acetylglucosamine 2-epimerase [Solitalea koreensis]|uniref:GDP/UDP-N,N'-diacetylbacillosamine 2-epimerase (Hydrolysing) n=1 Tax=Solitalea koreensis TaxID=543615 RepID=A0A521CNU9_9SPHI|nr:UDP-N-acetylglucosamine 2-epimerase [Solitalea koreensis]SMO61133.1 GDP/UDP-N,N'-diacetylbacillosamine 2-epimerase (hydrolysing) [Solitalea koreensis]